MTILIELSAEEIVDRVDEMLAWLAIASESNIDLDVRHLYRARPGVIIGDGHHATIVAAGAEAAEQAPTFDSVMERQSFALTATRYLREVPRLTYARLSEVSVLDEIMVPHQTGIGSGGDDVSDLKLAEKGEKSQSYIGIKYHLSSVADEDAAMRKAVVSSFRLPQAARVFKCQDILAFEDGRAKAMSSWFAAWNDRLYDLHRNPLGLQVYGTNAKYSYEAEMLLSGMCAEIERESEWTVELSLSKRRTGIGLQTDAIGAREFVNMIRGADSATDKRKSIVHWVSGYMRRKRRTDAEPTVAVPAHLRGKTGVDAGKYFARIWPSKNAISAASNGVRFGGNHAT